MTAPWKHSAKQREKARQQRDRARRRLQRKEEAESHAPPDVEWQFNPYAGNILVSTGMSRLINPHIVFSSASTGMIFWSGVDWGSLSTRQQAEPIVGWKRARMVRKNGRVRLYGAAVDHSYEAEATAKCIPPGWFSYPQGPEIVPSLEHQAPHPQCACGFYAVTDQTHWEVLRQDYPDSFVRLEVELYGKVLRYTRGYRAEKQRVLAAWVDPVCFGCLMWSNQGIERTPGAEMAGMVDAHGLLRPVCDRCAMGLAARLLVTLADISSDLGTEVRWWE